MAGLEHEAAIFHLLLLNSDGTLIDQAMAERARPERTPDRFAAMQEEGWEG